MLRPVLLSLFGRRPFTASALPFAGRPRSLWIELTSKCPFDCVFCSRSLRRGAGVHMDMGLFRRILGELQSPEIIRLNYSGESTHHPHIVEAIRLAAATGAATELVTALGSLPDRLVGPLAGSGLDRLTVSLHTLDTAQYANIYGHSSIEAVRQKIAALLAARDGMGSRTPVLDLAMVVMRRNLGQLQPLAAYAAEIGAAGLAIHPVIRRDPTPDRFEEELDGERLRPAFLAELAQQVAEIRRLHPGLPLSVSTPEIDDGAQRLCERPIPHPGVLPAGAQIHSCEQNPWDTVHILADGSVVSCEVRDRLTLGRIASDGSGPGLAEIWAGSAYADFRARYRAGAVPECRDCPYKTAFLPGPAMAFIAADTGAHAQLQHGWHPTDGSGLLWAKRSAALTLARASSARALHIAGLVPATVGRVRVDVDGVLAGWLAADAEQATWVAYDLPLPAGSAPMASIVLSAERALVPAREGLGADVRELGFGMQRIGLV
jgi:radical SAM protein with 4Fe4S-binding SPASM domain